MMIRRLATGVLALCLSTAALPPAGGAPIQVTPVVADGQVSASFIAPGAFGTDVREVIRSGLLLTFTFTVELRRPSSVWLDHTLGTVTVASSVKFDNLTGAYQVSKLQEGHVVWSKRTDDDTNVRTWMTTFERVPLSADEPLEPNSEYYVRVRMQSSPKRTFSWWPWTGDAGSGRADFTFIR
jgi:Domain of unknown function (DUF4390)